jgi:hypothetical protein
MSERYPAPLSLPSHSFGHGGKRRQRLRMAAPTERRQGGHSKYRLIDGQVRVVVDQPAKPPQRSRDRPNRQRHLGRRIRSPGAGVDLQREGARGWGGRVAGCTAALAIMVGCGSGAREGWTVERAESVTTIRGMNVHVLRCRPLGPGEDMRYKRFACEAGARRPGEAYDTVGILYQIRVEDDGYVLERVRFIGGPGIP